MKKFKTSVPEMEIEAKLHLRVYNSPLKGGQDSIGYMRLKWANALYATFNKRELKKQLKAVAEYYGVAAEDIHIISQAEWELCNPQKVEADRKYAELSRKFVIKLGVKQAGSYSEHFVEYPYLEDGAAKISIFISEYAKKIGVTPENVEILPNLSEAIDILEQNIETLDF